MSTPHLARFALVSCGVVAVLARLDGGTCYACAIPNRPARVTKLAPCEWEPPKGSIGPVSVDVRVTVDPKGNAVGVRPLPKGTSPEWGEEPLDRGGIQAARQSSYSPAIKSCQPIMGTVVVHFDCEIG